jgi:hypothetical protein
MEVGTIFEVVFGTQIKAEKWVFLVAELPYRSERTTTV